MSSARLQAGTASLCALLAGITWGFSGTLASLLPEGISSLTIGAFRLFIGGFFLLAYQYRNAGKIFRLKRGEGKTVLLSTAAIVFTQICFFTAVRKAGVGLSTMVYIGLSPLFAGVIEHLFDSVPLTFRWYRSVGLTLAGSVLLGIINRQGLTDPAGLLFALAASIGWSTTGVTMKRLQKTRGALEVTTGIMVLGGLAMCPLLVKADWSLILTPAAVPPLLLLGLLTASVPYALFNKSLEGIPAGHSFVLGMTEPLTAALLGVLLLKEPFSWLHFIGYMLIFAGVILLYLSGSRVRD